MILAAGVFIIALAGLGMTRSGQIKDYEAISGNLSFASTRLNTVQLGNLQTEIDEYKQQLKDTQEQVSEAKNKLDQTILSVDVADKFYEIANYCEVTVDSLSTTTITPEQFAAIDCETISVSATISGDLQNVLDLVMALNDNFSTGFVRSAQFSFNLEPPDSLSVQMVVYSRKGAGNE